MLGSRVRSRPEGLAAVVRTLITAHVPNRDKIKAQLFPEPAAASGQASASSKHFQEARHGRRSPAPVQSQSASA